MSPCMRVLVFLMPSPRTNRYRTFLHVRIRWYREKSLLFHFNSRSLWVYKHCVIFLYFNSVWLWACECWFILPRAKLKFQVSFIEFVEVRLVLILAIQYKRRSSKVEVHGFVKNISINCFSSMRIIHHGWCFHIKETFN